MAPGTTIVATRDAGSTIDGLHQDAVLDGDYFKGTGTSQAGAVVSGVAALLYQAESVPPTEHGEEHPDGKHLPGLAVPDGRRGGTRRRGRRRRRASGSGDWANVGLVRSLGAGSLESSRGRFHVHTDLDHDGQPDLVDG